MILDPLSYLLCRVWTDVHMKHVGRGEKGTWSIKVQFVMSSVWEDSALYHKGLYRVDKSRW
jgi:hypothetical protein